MSNILHITLLISTIILLTTKRTIRGTQYNYCTDYTNYYCRSVVDHKLVTTKLFYEGRKINTFERWAKNARRHFFFTLNYNNNNK